MCIIKTKTIKCSCKKCTKAEFKSKSKYRVRLDVTDKITFEFLSKLSYHIFKYHFWISFTQCMFVTTMQSREDIEKKVLINFSSCIWQQIRSNDIENLRYWSRCEISLKDLLA